MIFFNNNSTNTFAVTLTEGVTITGATTTAYTMSLTSDVSNVTLSAITLTDTSPHPGRFNLFNLTLTAATAQDKYNGLIHLQNEGFYQYKCYFSADTQQELLEEGIMFMSGVTYAESIFEDTSTDKDDYYVID